MANLKMTVDDAVMAVVQARTETIERVARVAEEQIEALRTTRETSDALRSKSTTDLVAEAVLVATQDLKLGTLWSVDIRTSCGSYQLVSRSNNTAAFSNTDDKKYRALFLLLPVKE